MLRLALVTAVVAIAFPLAAHAAGTAYGVDTAEVSEAGSCKVEAWVSRAGNQDLVATTNPACVADLGRLVEFSAQLTRSRADDEWATSIAPKMKMKLSSTSIGGIGWAAASGLNVDARTGEVSTVFAYAPATLRLSEITRINLNGGWTWDRELNRNLVTYGAGFDWKMTPVLILTLETFGQYTDGPYGPTTRPRFQAGMRYRPIDTLSFDVIYGRNINGEDANWITFATTVRFPPEGSTAKLPF